MGICDVIARYHIQWGFMLKPYVPTHVKLPLGAREAILASGTMWRGRTVKARALASHVFYSWVQNVTEPEAWFYR